MFMLSASFGSTANAAGGRGGEAGLVVRHRPGSEVRWISTGIASSGSLLVVSYRWAELDATNVFVRNWVSPSLSHSR
jgi:hypothetical protein